MRIDVLTLFPEMFPPVLNTSIIGRAVENGKVELHYHNIRDFSVDRRKRVDDYPYGGGLGMVLQCQPICDGITHVKRQCSGKIHVVLMSPYGKVFDQKKAEELKEYQNLLFVCGHYEGIDYRVNELMIDEEISVGNFILTGGELPAMSVIDAVIRLLPGVLKVEDSYGIESYSNSLLEYPQYTRPPEFMGSSVPEILVSGHHENVFQWRRYQSLRLTYLKRPDLLAQAELTEQDKKWLEEIKAEVLNQNK